MDETHRLTIAAVPQSRHFATSGGGKARSGKTRSIPNCEAMRRWCWAGRKRPPILAAISVEGLTDAELRWLMGKEYAKTAGGVFWRRMKPGLRLRADRIAVLDAWMPDRGAI